MSNEKFISVLKKLNTLIFGNDSLSTDDFIIDFYYSRLRLNYPLPIIRFLTKKSFWYYDNLLKIMQIFNAWVQENYEALISMFHANEEKTINLEFWAYSEEFKAQNCVVKHIINL